jgi:hypothetical protein
MTTDKLPTEGMIEAVTLRSDFTFVQPDGKELLRITADGQVIAPDLEAANEAGRVFVESVRHHQAVRPPVGEGWQPIKTAPKDGTLIIGREGSFVISLLWRDIYKGFVSPMKVGWEQVIEPTHWMPILAMQSNG